MESVNKLLLILIIITIHFTSLADPYFYQNSREDSCIDAGDESWQPRKCSQICAAPCAILNSNTTGFVSAATTSLRESPARLCSTLARAFGEEVSPVKVRTLNERNNHRVKLYRSGITYRWCESIAAPFFRKGSNHSSPTESGHHHLISSQPSLQHPKHLTEGQESNQRSKQAEQLWPGARFTQLDRTKAIYRGMRFIYRMALIPHNFAAYGSDFLWWFYNVESTVRDANLRRMARRMGRERALRWRRLHRSLPRKPDAGTISDYVFGSQAADDLDVRDDQIKRELQRVANRFSARDYLEWNPLEELPPTDVPEECEYDGAGNPRGAKFCHICKRPLEMRSRYDVWYDALITTYTGDTYGVTLGAHYVDVLRWLPTLRPYRGRENDNNPDFYDTIYAITHIVYTLNDYDKYRLSPQWLPQEYEFLKTNLKEAIADEDAETLGECLDTLKSFGLTENDLPIRAGTEYLLSHQNRDGSWGDIDEADIYDRYHPTLTAVSGLCEYDWHGDRLSFPEIKPLLEQWAAEAASSPR